MKKVIAAALIAVGIVTTASAEGYQVNTLSAKQNGMGHTGVAQKLGAESMIFNPAGMAWMDNTIDLTGSFTAIFATATCTHGDNKYTTNNDPSTPLAFNLGMNVYKNLKAGISFYTPYGSGINWGENWPGASFNQSVTLKAFTIQPTLAYRILPNLSVGAGAMVTWGTVDLNKGIIGGQTFSNMAQMMGINWPSDITPASLNLNGKSNVAVGVNVGLMWDINNKWSVGASFRSKMDMKIEGGVATFNYADPAVKMMLENYMRSKLPAEMAASFQMPNEANFTASMPCAAVWNLGVSYRPTRRWLVAADFQLTQWKAYKNLKVDFLEASYAPLNQNIAKNYRNSMTYKVGAQYAATERFDVRMGMMIDTTPVRNNHYNPETPGMTKVSPSIGFSFRPIKNFSIDASLLYVAGLGSDNCTVTNPSFGEVFTADYEVHAWNPSIGVSYRF